MNGKAAERDDLWTLVQKRRKHVRAFLNWANERELNGQSLRFENRRDIEESKKAAKLFANQWWGLVVYTCFHCFESTRYVSRAFRQPVTADKAERVLSSRHFSTEVWPRPKVAEHRKIAGLKGAKIALISACERQSEFRRILLDKSGFEDRFLALRSLMAPQWGRTTCFDLLVRAGSIGIGGAKYRPQTAHLAGSTGPSKGFKKIWGKAVTNSNAEECESGLHWWTDNWKQVANEVGATWSGEPYDSADFENALCVFHAAGERRLQCGDGGKLAPSKEPGC
jgi:hypothetical protein